jgi:hypothetical protein
LLDDKPIEAALNRDVAKGEGHRPSVEMWVESVRAYDEKRRQMARLEWHLHHTAQAERLRRTLEALASHQRSRLRGWRRERATPRKGPRGTSDGEAARPRTDATPVRCQATHDGAPALARSRPAGRTWAGRGGPSGGHERRRRETVCKDEGEGVSPIEQMHGYQGQRREV